MKNINCISVILTLFLIFISTDVSESLETIILNTDNSKTISSVNFPRPYPSGTTDWTIKNSDGYGVEVIVKSLDLDGSTKGLFGEVGDYLLIRPGGIKEYSENPLYFTWNLKSERKFRLVHLDELYIQFHAKLQISNTHKGFEIELRSLGVKITTTPPPVTITPPPLIVEPLETAYLYLKGMTPEEFNNISECKDPLPGFTDENCNETNAAIFRRTLAGIAENYCKENNITVAENITIDNNVNFHVITHCNLNWPNYENCVSLKYSIPVNFFNVSNGYDLTTEHLDDMWSKYNQFNETNILQKYHPPNDHSVLMSWIWAIVGVIIAFIILLYVIWKYNCFDDYISSILIHEDVEHRKSDTSFFPIPHQDIPPLFEFDSFPTEEKIWNDTLPPEYSEKPRGIGIRGQINDGFDEDDEIHMALEDSTEQRNQTLRRSVDTVEADESNL